MEFRKFCNLSDAETFDDLREISNLAVRMKMKELYGHPGNVDVWVGGVLEDQVKEGRVGPLFRCLLLEQFRRLRDGDRFWYENPSTFKPEQLVQIKQYSLSHVLCENGDNLTRITPDVFVLPERQGGYTDCENIPTVDFSVWAECCDDCRSRVLNSVNRFRRSLEEPTMIYSNTTLNKIDLDENTRMSKRIVDLEQTIKEMQHTIQKMSRTINKMEKNKCKT